MRMQLFKQRIQATLDILAANRLTEWYESMSLSKQISHNRNVMKWNRKGDYLIKVARNGPFFAGNDEMYINFTYISNGYVVLGSRKDAQWFSGKEAQEFIYKQKGFTIVKK